MNPPRMGRKRSRPATRLITHLVLVAVWLASLFSGASQPLPPEEIYQRTLPGVMTLEVETRGGELSIGTAFLALTNGIGVTAWHLVQDARRVSARFADREKISVAGIIDWDEVKDIALVKLTDTGRPLNSLCLTNPPVGARAYVIGAPKGYEFSISDGLVSQIQTIDGFDQCQISCPISPGNSGGPVLNGHGAILGVVSWSKLEAQNLSFATPASCLLALNPQAAMISWGELPRQRRARLRLQAAVGHQQARLSETTTSRDLDDLRRLLQKAAGENITVTVRQGPELRSFNITIPKDFVKP